MNTLPEPTPGRLLALVAPYAARDAMLEFAALLAQHGPLQVLDGGNRFNVYRVARLLARLAYDEPGQRAGLPEALARIYVARAFTCYQMAALLERTPAGTAPTLVVDFLDTFYDQSVPLGERRRLLEVCLGHLRRLSRRAALVVSLRPPPPDRDDPTGLLERVQSAADHIWFQEAFQLPSQPRLL